MAPDSILVIGDGLIDIVQSADGHRTESPGGAALNVAVGLARMGAPTWLARPRAHDARGRLLEDFLSGNGVTTIALPAGPRTGWALSRQVGDGVEYVFSPEIRHRVYTFPPAAVAEMTGARAVVISSFPIDDLTAVEAVLAAVTQIGAPLAIDPNVRPHLLTDRDAYRTGFEKLAARAALVRASREDLELLYPTIDDAAAWLRERSPRRSPG